MHRYENKVNSVLFMLVGFPTLVIVNLVYMVFLSTSLSVSMSNLLGTSGNQALICYLVVLAEMLLLRAIFKDTFVCNKKWFLLGSVMGYLALLAHSLVFVDGDVEGKSFFTGLIIYYIAGVVLAYLSSLQFDKPEVEKANH